MVGVDRGCRRAAVFTVICTNKDLAAAHLASAPPSSSTLAHRSRAADGKPPAFAAPADLGLTASTRRPPKPPARRSTCRGRARRRTRRRFCQSQHGDQPGHTGLQLDNAKAPCTVNSFASLAQQGYFNDTQCHWPTTGGPAVPQCGDPTGTGTGARYQFANEYPTNQYQRLPHNPALQQPVLYSARHVGHGQRRAGHQR